MHEKLEKLLSDESFLAKLEGVESPDEFLALLQGEGLTGDEAKEALAAFKELAAEQGEISEEELEDVAGGTVRNGGINRIRQRYIPTEIRIVSRFKRMLNKARNW